MTDAKQQAPKVGAPDPELKNSPIFDSTDSDELSLDLELEELGRLTGRFLETAVRLLYEMADAPPLIEPAPDGA